MNSIINTFSQLRIQDVIDILVITYIIYRILDFLKETRAEQLIKGIAIILVLTAVSEWLQLYTVNYLLSNFLTVGAIAIIVVFQPELRRGLEHLGRARIFPRNILDLQKNEALESIDAITSAVGSLSRQKIGAIIVIEKNVGLKEIIETGTLINGAITPELLINIFIPNTPLHDGAVVIRHNKIVAAGCFLPLSENMTISKEMGTRHRAALGMSEKSDSLTLIVSEETGTISIAEAGTISRYLDIETLDKILRDAYKINIEEEPLDVWGDENEPKE